jgi:hypothetical protein
MVSPIPFLARPSPFPPLRFTPLVPLLAAGAHGFLALAFLMFVLGRPPLVLGVLFHVLMLAAL